MSIGLKIDNLPTFNIVPDFNLFVTGGFVRDSLLHIASKDIDIACEAKSFTEMSDWVEKTHSKVFLSNPEFLTIRALYKKGDARDYVLCRKDGAYSDGRHPDEVSAGSILDDLSRRDFTIGAMAIDLKTGQLIDPHGGASDLKQRLIRTVGRASDRFEEDPLRMLRAIRFAITKGFFISDEILNILSNPDWAEKLLTVSSERIREEVFKCFVFDTVRSMEFLCSHCSAELKNIIFGNTGIWLKPTMEAR